MSASPTMPVRNPRLAGFRSLDGHTSYGVEDLFEGCPAARTAGRPTSVAAFYRDAPLNLAPGGHGIDRYGEWLPYLRFAGLGEGGTPLLPLPGAARRHGLGSLLVKREAANPTGSHKDRMSPLV
ncbi:MAG: pyridoxal-5'-phosphate-dependent protein subunit beta, partial [Alphaproteobacteria bacterium]|nr:pyridoxal-5'-phosphate-dependent protein subunit beta [Alphaproteobacteria bacterium]